MAANEFSEFQQKKTLGRSAAPKKETARKTGSKGSMNMKPAFPKAALPGKTQPKDRSGGVKKAVVDPNRMGL